MKYALLILTSVLLSLSAQARTSCALSTTLSDRQTDLVSIVRTVEKIQSRMEQDYLPVGEAGALRVEIQAMKQQLMNELRGAFPGGLPQIESVVKTNEGNRRTQLAKELLNAHKTLIKLGDQIVEREAGEVTHAIFQEYIESLGANDNLSKPIATSDSIKAIIQSSLSLQLDKQTVATMGEVTHFRGKKLEGEVADYVDNGWGDILSVNERLHDAVTGRDYETDIRMGRVFIEVTAGTGGKFKQIFDRYFSSYVNPNDMPVVLYAPNLSTQATIQLLTEASAERKPFAVVRSLKELNSLLDRLYH